MLPSLISQFSNPYALGEEIQKMLLKANVVKTLNIVNYEVMIDAKFSSVLF